MKTIFPCTNKSIQCHPLIATFLLIFSFSCFLNLGQLSAQCPSITPIALPFLEDFSTIEDTTLIESGGLCEMDKVWTFETVVGLAQFGTGVFVEGVDGGALMLFSPGEFEPNSITLTLNMSNYIGAANILLSFDFANIGGNVNIKDSVWVRGSHTDAWVGLYKWEQQNEQAWVTVPDLDISATLAVAGQAFSNSFQIRFGREGNFGLPNPGAAPELVLDNIRLSACLKPTNLTATNITSTSATLGWIEPNEAMNWNIEYGVKGFRQGEGEEGISFFDNSFELLDLTGDTEYDFYVRSSCEEEFTSWAGPFSFRTLCASLTPVTLPFLEDFEEVVDTTFTANSEFCSSDKVWTFETTNGRARFGTDALFKNGGKGALLLDGTNGYSQNNAILTLDMSNYTNYNGTKNIHLTFDYYDGAEITDPNDSIWVRGSDTDVWLAIYGWQGQTELTWLNSPELDISTVLADAGQTFSATFQVRIGQNGEDRFLDRNGLVIDNILIDICSELAPTNLSVNNLTSNSVALNWSEDGAVISWDLEWGTSGFTLGQGTQLIGLSDSIYQLSGLSPNTLYDFYVRSDCGDGKSFWTGPYAFSTLCADLNAITLPYTEDFDNNIDTILLSSGTICTMDRSWEFETTTGRARFGDSVTVLGFNSGALLLDNPNGFSTNNAILTLNMSNYMEANNILLTFDFFDSGDENHTNDSVWIRGSHLDNWIGLYDWQWQTEYFWLTSPELDIAAVLTEAGQALSSTFQIRFGQEDGSSFRTDGLVIDNINLELCPKPTNLKTENIAITSTTLIWTEIGEATNWNVEWGVKGFNQGDGQVGDSFLDNSFEISGLIANTDYDFYVQSSCEETFTLWAGPFTFRTLCGPPNPITLPFIEDFENITDTTFLDTTHICQPNGNWLYETTGGRVRLGTDTERDNGGLGALQLESYRNEVSINDAILTLDMSNYVDSNNVFLSFDYYSYWFYYTDNDSIWIRGNKEAEWIALYNWERLGGNFWRNSPELDLDATLADASQTFSNSFQVRFGQNSPIDTYESVLLDNILIDDCPKPAHLKATSLAPNGVMLSWKELGSATNWEIEWGTIDLELGNGNIITNLSDTTYQLLGLTANTTYYFRVRANCGDGTSAWSIPYIFTTLCLPLPPVILPFLEDFENSTDTTLGANGQICEMDNNWIYETDGGRAKFGKDVPFNNITPGAMQLENLSDFSTNNAMLTLNMSDYIDANNVFLRFDFLSIHSDNPLNDSVWIRGSRSEEWLGIYSWHEQRQITWNTSTDLDLDATLKKAGQAFSNSFQIRFGQDGSYANDREYLIVDNILIGNCSKPTNVEVTNITTSNAEVNWTELGNASSWTIEWGIKGFLPGNGLKITGVDTTAYTLSNLIPATAYDIYLRSNCGNEGGNSDWTEVYTFHTNCPTLTPISLPFTEDFENIPAITFTENGLICQNYGSWRYETDSGHAQFGADASRNNGGLGALSLSGSGTPNLNDAMLTLDMSNYVSATDIFLSFDFYDNRSANSQNDSIWIRGSNTENWIGLYNWNEQTQDTWRTTPQLDIIDTLTNAGQTLSSSFQIRFSQPELVYSWNEFFIDNIQISGCLSPDSLMVRNITATSAELNWKNLGNNHQWDIEWGVTGFSNGSGVIIAGVDTNIYVLSNLLPTTSFDFYVRSNCGTSTSRWIGPYTFMTACPTISPVSLPFLEDFETIVSGTYEENTIICKAYGEWNYQANGGRVRFGMDAPINNGGSGALLLDGQTTGDNAMLTLDMSNYIGSEDIFLSCDFYNIRNGNGNNDSIWIRESSENEWISIYNWQEQAENTWITSPELDLDAALTNAGQTFSNNFQIRFGQDGYYFYSRDGLLIDNILISTCGSPDTLTATNITSSSVDLGWKERGVTTTWDIEWGKRGFIQGSGTIVTGVTTNSYTLQNLEAGTSYDFYVRADCGAETSLWAGPFTFHTFCNTSTPITLPFIEDFENIADTTFFENGLVCTTNETWTYETDRGRAQFGTDAPINNGGVGALLLDNPNDNSTNNAILTLDMSNYSDASNIILSFDFYDADDETSSNDRIWIRGSHIDTWLEVFNWQENPENTWLSTPEINITTVLVENEQSFSNNFQIRFGQYDDYDFSTDGLVIDNIKIEICPRPNALMASNITETKVDLSWTERGTAMTWEIEWGEHGFIQGNGTIITGVATNPYTLQNLAAGTFYDFYVRADCGEESSVWAGPFSFNTACRTVPIGLPYIEDFENINSIEFTENGFVCTVDARWNYETTGGRARFGTLAPKNNGGEGALLLDNTNSTRTNYAILTLDMSNYSNQRGVFLSFDYLDVYNSNASENRVWIRGNDTDTWLEIYDWQIGEPYIWITTPELNIDSTLQVNGQNFSKNFQIRFGQRGYYTYNSDGLLLDNITLGSCPKPTNLNTVYFNETSTVLSWKEIGIAQNWDIEWGTVGYTLGEGTFVKDLASSNYSLSGLTAGTSYDFYVRSNCDANNTSAWAGPFNFTFETPYIYPTNFIENFENFNNPHWTGNHNIGFNHSVLNRILYYYLYEGRTLDVTTPYIGTIGADDWLALNYRYINFFDPSSAKELAVGDTLNIQISTDYGTSFTTIDQIHTGNHVTSRDRVQLTYDLSEYEGAVIQVRIYATWGSGNYYLELDDFFIGNTRMSIADASLPEGDIGGVTDLVFKVSLDSNYPNSISVAYEAIDSTAIFSDGDYMETKGSLTFLPGETEKDIIIPILGDDIAEMDEVIHLKLFDPLLTTITDSIGRGVILNDDFSEPIPQANANEDQLNSCGTTVQLNALLGEMDASLGWRIVSGIGGILEQELLENALFTGAMGEMYELEWTVNSPTGQASSDTMVVSFNPDTDNDGVQDCQDICPDGDDSIDTDGDTQPDACDCNPNDATDSLTIVTNNHPDNRIADSTYQSSVQLRGTGTVKNGSTVIFKAGQVILLTTGFHAEAGSNFQGLIEACTPIETVVEPIAIAENSRQNTLAIVASEGLKSTASTQMYIRPNLIRNKAIIQIDLPKPAQLTLSLYNANGQQVRVYLKDIFWQAGKHRLSFKRDKLPAGIYFMQLRSETGIITKKLLVQQ